MCLNDNREFHNTLGSLFEGVNTNLENVQRLADWYHQSRTWLLEHPGLITKVSLTELKEARIAQLALRAPTLLEEVEQVCRAKEQLQRILGRPSVAETETDDLGLLVRQLESWADQLVEKSDFFTRVARPNLSCERAAELLEARLKTAEADPELEVLLTGLQTLGDAGGEAFKTPKDESFDNWFSFLQKVRSRCTKAQALTELLGTDFSHTAGLEQIGRFLVAKLELDRCVAALAPATWKLGLENWPSYIAAAQEVAVRSEYIVVCLATEHTANVPLSELMQATQVKILGDNALNQALRDPEASRLFGRALTEVDTDVSALATTHEWGRQVTRLGNRISPKLRDHLLRVFSKSCG